MSEAKVKSSILPGPQIWQMLQCQ